MASGVEVRGQTVRVYFNYQGEKCREPLFDLDPMKSEHIAYAERMVEQIRYEIKTGVFDYLRYFPNSNRQIENRLGHYLDLWLEIKQSKVADSTFRGYKGLAEKHIRPKFGNLQTDKIDYIQIEKWLSNELKDLASKTQKEAIAVLSQIFRLYRTRFPNVPNPTDEVVVKLPDDDDPDPFTREEINKILNTPPRDERIQELNLIKFMIWSGPRVSEGLAFAWEDVIDLDRGLIQFKRARVRGLLKVTKTKRSKRIIELLKPAREVLQDQWKISGNLDPVEVDVKDRDNRTIKKEKLRFVFLNSNTGKPHNCDFNLRERFFRAHLNRAGVRYRGPGQTRHTFASQLLTAAMPIEWIVEQLGHTTADMLRKKYGKWISEDADDMVALAESKLKL